MYDLIKKYFSTLVFLIVGIACILFAVKNQNIPLLIRTIKNVNFSWYLPVLICTILCHYFRTKRWQLLLQQNEYKITTLHTYNALMSAYVVNFATGKLGELYRCAVVNKYSKIPFSFSFATVIIERVIDVLSLFILLLFSFIIYQGIILEFINKYVVPIFENFNHYRNYLLVFFIVLVVISILLFIIRKPIINFIQAKWTNFYNGIISVLQLPNKLVFISYTILIWLMYLGMTYFWFFAFNDIHLTLGTALLVIVIGGVGRSLPVPAHGIGTYHLCASFALSACLVTAAESMAIPIVIHAGQTLFYLVFGIISMSMIGFSKWSLKNDN